MESAKSIPGAGIEPARPNGAQDFKSDPSPLGDNNITLSPSERTLVALALDGPDSATLATSAATTKKRIDATGNVVVERAERGPMQRALREAGLPATLASFQLLANYARQWKLVPMGQSMTPKLFLRAARVYRQVIERHARAVAFPTGMTKSKAKKLLVNEHKLGSGRQWKKWRKQQMREQRAAQREASTDGQ